MGKVGKEHDGEAPCSPSPAQTKGFATTPEVLRHGGPQMEDYPDFESWLFARRVWASEHMGIVNPRMREAAERMRLRTSEQKG